MLGSMTDRHRRLVELIREQVGEHFRSAFRYDADSWDALYVRSDLATADLESAVPGLADRARADEPLIREADYPALGSQRASISLHDEAVLIHFYEGASAGVVLTLDTVVAPSLSEFVASCERVLDD